MSGKITKPEYVRFWGFVKKTESCWLWTGSKQTSGYGNFTFREGTNKPRWTGAHRYSWALANGLTIPKGLYVIHSCDNKLCVNPMHLSVAQPKENSRQAVERLKMNIGKNNGNNKIPWRTICRIRILSERGKKPAEIAARLSLRTAYVSAVAKGKTRTRG
jgi:hypothetical protein